MGCEVLRDLGGLFKTFKMTTWSLEITHTFFRCCWLRALLVYICAQYLSGVCLFATPWTVAHQAPLSMGFCRQEYWRGLPFPPPGDLPNLGTELWTLVSCIAGRFFTTELPGSSSYGTLIKYSIWTVILSPSDYSQFSFMHFLHFLLA